MEKKGEISYIVYISNMSAKWNISSGVDRIRLSIAITSDNGTA